MEDVNNVVAPMSFIGVAGYLVAIYVSTGLIDAEAQWVALLSLRSRSSDSYLMLSRVIAGDAGSARGMRLAAAILRVVSIIAMLWLAARALQRAASEHRQSP
jgi:hypothetical protein